MAQVDGSVLFLAASGMYALEGGVIRGRETSWIDPWSLVGLRRLADGDLEVVTRSAVARLDPDGSLRNRWLPVGWAIDQTADLGGGRTLVVGGGEARLLAGDEVVDVTPVRTGTLSGLRRETLGASVVMDDGRLLSWSHSSDRFLIRDADQWFLVQPAADPDFGYWAPRSLQRTEGGYLGFDSSRIFVFVPDGWAP